jgi:hypothetical protein
MTSAILNNAAKAANSASATQLKQNEASKGRSRYSLPSKPSHLSDKAARKADHALKKQFFKSTRSITPPPEASNWAHRNNVLLEADATNMHERFSRPKKRHNAVSQDDADAAPTKLRIFTGHGGTPELRRMVKLTLDSGLFDNEVEERYAQIHCNNTSMTCSISIEKYHNVTDYEQSRNNIAANRCIAEKSIPLDEAIANNIAGAVSEEFTFDELDARCTSLGI